MRAVRRLCKAEESYGTQQCPAVYLTDDPATMIVQGTVLDTAALATLLDLAPDETAVAIPTETLLRGLGLLLAERDRADLLADIETCLAETGLTAAGR